jgi:tRNA:m4X modification enzyme
MTFALSRILADPSRSAIAETSRIVLVDRASQRHKMDNRLKDGPDAVDGLAVTRMKADLEHLVLDTAFEELGIFRGPGLEEDSAAAAKRKVVAFTKHLCGAATDYAVRCLAACEKVESKVLCFATCCHHRCEWKSYVGKQFFKVCFKIPDRPLLGLLV